MKMMMLMFFYYKKPKGFEFYYYEKNTLSNYIGIFLELKKSNEFRME